MGGSTGPKAAAPDTALSRDARRGIEPGEPLGRKFPPPIQTKFPLRTVRHPVVGSLPVHPDEREHLEEPTVTRMQNHPRPALTEVFADGAVTVPETTRFSGIGRTQLYDLMATGRLPFTKVGARRLIPRRGLIDLLAGAAGPDAAA